MDTKALRQKILDLAIRGKLVPQDPNDEPASILLSRIRAEKEKQIKAGKQKKATPATTDTPHYQQPFEIPDSWEWCTVGEISNYGSCSNSLVENIPDNAWVLELEDLEKDTGRILQRKLKSDREIKGVRHPFTKGVVLYSKLRTYLNKVLVAPENGFCTTEIVPITPEKGVFAPYLCLILRSSYFLSYTAMCGYGVKMPRLSTDDARKALIPLPPFREQERIVAIVSQCELLFHEIETEGNNIESLVEYAKNKILSLAISGKLVPQDPKDEPAIDLLHRINPKFTPDTSHCGNLPKGWALCHIGDIGETELGKTLDVEKNTGQYRPYLCSLNVLRNGFDLATVKQMKFEEKELDRYRLRKGDLLICEGGDVGRCAIWNDDVEMYYQNALHRVRFKAGILPQYFQFYFTYAKGIGMIDEYSKGMTLKHFTKTSLSVFPLSLPPINEQKRIVAKVEELFARLDEIAGCLA